MKTLHRLIQDGDHAGLEARLRTGADPDAADGDEDVPLEIALAGRDLESLRTLVAHGADCTLVRPFHISPLLRAIDDE